MAKSGISHIVTSVPVPRSAYESEAHHALSHGSAFPASPSNYQLFFRDDLSRWYIYYGTSWYALNETVDLQTHASRHQDGGADEINIAALSGEPATLTTHKDLTTGIHGVGASTIASAANIATHAGLTTNVHGVGTLGFKVTSKVIRLSRDLTLATGDVSYTGVGFTPTTLIQVGMKIDGVEASYGFYDKSGVDEVVLRLTTAHWYHADNQFLSLGIDYDNLQRGAIKTLDADGFTITWSKAGSPTGTASFIVLCLK